MLHHAIWVQTARANTQREVGWYKTAEQWMPSTLFEWWLAHRQLIPWSDRDSHSEPHAGLTLPASGRHSAGELFFLHASSGDEGLLSSEHHASWTKALLAYDIKKRRGVLSIDVIEFASPYASVIGSGFGRDWMVHNLWEMGPEDWTSQVSLYAAHRPQVTPQAPRPFSRARTPSNLRR